MGSPVLAFPLGFDERVAFETEQRGVCDVVLVGLPNGTRVQVGFYDPVRLAQNLASRQEAGEAWIALPGMIVIPSVTLKFMQRAVTELFQQGFFDVLRPI